MAKTIHIDIPYGTMEIVERAYCCGQGGCEPFDSVTIPITVTKIAYQSFVNCYKLRTVYYDGTLNDWLNIDHKETFGGPLDYAKKFYVKKPKLEDFKSQDIDADIEAGEGYMLVDSFTVESYATSTPKNAFCGYQGMKKVYYNGTADEWASINHAFGGPLHCGAELYFYGKKVEEVELSVTTVNENAFSGCTSLKKVTLASTVKELGAGVFHHCNNLTQISLGANLEKIGAFALSSTGISDTKLPRSLKTIGAHAFAFAKLTSIVIPISVKRVERSILCECNNIKVINCEAKKRGNDWHKEWNRKGSLSDKTLHEVAWKYKQKESE